MTASMRVKPTDLWWTPHELVGLALHMFPRGYMDPCGCRGAPLTAAASAICDDDGLSATWDPTMPAVVNPPWSQTRVWAAKLAGHQSGGLLIAPMRLDAGWVRAMGARCAAIFVPPGRLTYLDPATGERPGCPITSSCVYCLTDPASGLDWCRINGWSAWRRVP